MSLSPIPLSVVISRVPTVLKINRKVSILLMVLTISFINVSGNVLEICANIATKSLSCELSRTLNLDVSEIVVHFYDFQNLHFGYFPINKAAQRILSLENINKSNKLFMFMPGFRSKINTKTTERIKNAFKTIKNSYLIIIDHSAYTNDDGGCKPGYDRSVQHVPYIGKMLAQMLADLVTGGISAKNIHCIGHSLGSQILSHVGENFIKATSQKISRITALDPAGPCFVNQPIDEHIRSGVAGYVEVYHCNAGALGSSKMVADVDFFVNNGQSQPNCGKSTFNPLGVSKCSHKTCITMWIASVTHPQRHRYTAYKCQSYNKFRKRRCFQNEKTTAGFWNPGTAKGVYYFSTD